MKKFFLGAVLAIASIGAAFAQPGPLPSPWSFNGSATNIYFNGCAQVPVTVTGGCKGNGTINAAGIYINGTAVTAGGVTSFNTRTGAVTPQSGDYSVGQVTGAAPLASPTFTGTVIIPDGSTLGTPNSLTLTNATGLPIAGISATGTPGPSNYLRGDGTWATVTGGVSSVFTRTGAVTAQTGDYLIGQIGGLGTGIATALGTNVGTAGSLVVQNGALGTPSSGDASNLINIPVANATGVLPAANGGAGAINGILQANGSGVISALTIGSGLSYSAGTLSTTGSGVTITPTSGNVAGDVVCMQNTTTVIQDCGFSATAIPTNNLTTTLNAKTGAYTIATTDAGKINYLNSASPFTFTVPAGATLGAGFATDIGNANTGLLTSTLASGTWADTGNASIATVQGQELFTWVGASNNVHSWVSMPPLVAHGIVANNTANKDYGTSFNNANVTALLAGNLAAVNVANTYSAEQDNCITPLTAVSNVFTPDGSCNNYVLTLGATNTLANWSTARPGATGWIRINQDATGGRTIGTYGSQINSPGGTASNTFSAGANAWDTYSYYIYDSTHIWFAPAGLNASH